jgi:hypothetical protein
LASPSADPKAGRRRGRFNAEHVKIVPSLRSLLANRVEITSIEIDKPYLSAVRITGKLLILPGLFEPEQRQTVSMQMPGTLVISRIVITTAPWNCSTKPFASRR